MGSQAGKRASKFGVIVIFLLGSICVPGAYAASVKYAFPKLTAMVFDDSPKKRDALYALGATYGYVITSNIALELDGNYGMFGGKYSTNGKDGSFDVWNVGAHGAFRFPLDDNNYLKAKAGIVYHNVDHKMASTGATDETDGSAFSFGVAFGHIFSNDITFELEYSRAGTVYHNFTLGIHYPVRFD